MKHMIRMVVCTVLFSTSFLVEGFSGAPLSVPEFTLSSTPKAGEMAVRVAHPPEKVNGWSLFLYSSKSESALVALEGNKIPADGILLTYPRLSLDAQYKLVMRIDDGYEPFEIWLFLGVDAQGRILPEVAGELEFLSEKNMLKISKSSVPARMKSWSMKLQPVTGGSPVYEKEGPLPLKRRFSWRLPKLSVGDYVAVLTFSTSTNALSPKAETIEIRRHFRKEFDFRFAYFPSSHALRLFIPSKTLTNVEALEGKTDWMLELRAQGKKKVLAHAKGPLPFVSAGVTMNLPELPVGDYELTCSVVGDGETLDLTRKFMRREHEWEGLDLGKDDVIIPPFTPLEVDLETSTVGCILRKYQLAPNGLWRQVLSQGRKLLSEPMRLEAVIGGKTFTAVGEGVHFTQIEPTKVAGKAHWSAGPLKGSTEFEFDFDGFMQVRLALQETPEVVESLKLILPMVPEETSLMHSVTDYLRFHYANRIPEGEGLVWDSSSLNRRRIYLKAPFVPYIYMGGPERGICWAAESDRDWVIDREGGKASLEIIRDKERASVDLMVNLISKPSSLTRDRNISFFLQATPAKPMPEEPYHWRRWQDHSDQETQDVNFHMWGGTEYWGAYFMVADYFPEGKDFSWFEVFGEGRRRAASGDPKPLSSNLDFLERKLAKYRSILPEDRLSYFRAHWAGGLNWSRLMPANTVESTKFHYLFPYTSPRSVTAYNNDGFRETYLDEWSMVDVADPNWEKIPRVMRKEGRGKGSVWYEIEPVETFVDMALFYHKKMYETFADGIYWDNFFLQACYTPHDVGGPGYVDDEGVLRPGVNLLAFRNLVRRNAVMMHQMGRRPLAWIHMTNVNIIPMLSFGTLNYDWEWRDLGDYASMDLQDRLGADKDTALILVQSLGLKSGNPTVIVNRFNPPKESSVSKEWLLRTVQAVAIPHEMKMHQGGAVAFFVQAEMEAFGYGQEDCTVYRYWESPFPLKTEGANNHALVLKRGKRVMIGLGNYGPLKEADTVDEDQIDAASPQSVQEYDAIRESETKRKGAEQGSVDHEEYTVRLKLDLKALGLPETVQAYDVELQARREKVGKAGMPFLSEPDTGNVLVEQGDDKSVEVRTLTYTALIDAQGTIALSVKGAPVFVNTFGPAGSPPVSPPSIRVAENKVTVRSGSMRVEWIFGDHSVGFLTEGYAFECQLDSSIKDVVASDGERHAFGSYAGGSAGLVLANGQVLESKEAMHVHNRRYFPAGYARGAVKKGDLVMNEFRWGDPRGTTLKRVAPGVFEMKIRKHDFALILVE